MAKKKGKQEKKPKSSGGKEKGKGSSKK